MPHPLSRRSFFGATLAPAFVACRTVSSPATLGSVAFSLRQAERLLRAGHASAELSSLAGIGQFLGVVYDRASQDMVVVGRRLKGASLSLDDLAAAIQARVVHQEWPLVSIDRVADTQKTGLQRVRWEGGVAASALGATLLAADELLKKAALGLPAAAGLPFQSYFDLCAGRAALGKLAPGGNRFWFHAVDAAMLSRENVFILQDLNVGVKSLLVSGTGARDELADRYAAVFTANYEVISQRHAEIARLKPLFDAVAVAHGIESLAPQLSEFWGHRYQPARVYTPAEYPLLKRREHLKTGAKEVTLELSGGVDTRIFVQRLRDGDHVAFQEAVMGTKPFADALSWPLPLSAWAGKTELAPNEAKLISAMAGTTINTMVNPRPSNPGGVYVDIPVNESDIRTKK
jgi:hypothetical protein